MLGAVLGDPGRKVTGVGLRALGLGRLSGLGPLSRTDPASGSMVEWGEAVVVGVLVAGLPGRAVGGGR